MTALEAMTEKLAGALYAAPPLAGRFDYATLYAVADAALGPQGVDYQAVLDGYAAAAAVAAAVAAGDAPGADAVASYTTTLAAQDPITAAAVTPDAP